MNYRRTLANKNRHLHAYFFASTFKFFSRFVELSDSLNCSFSCIFTAWAAKLRNTDTVRKHRYPLMCGRTGGTRTHDQSVKSRLLYQLSYRPICGLSRDQPEAHTYMMLRVTPCKCTPVRLLAIATRHVTANKTSHCLKGKP